MINKVRVLIATVVLLLATTRGWAEVWPSANVGRELNLPGSTAGGLEIRVWLGGGAFEPSDLYRVVQANGVVSVSSIAWAPIPKEQENLRTAKEAAHEAKELRRVMAKYRCAGPVNVTPSYFWCNQPIKRTGPWSVLLNDLLPEQLWALPEKVDRNCGWGRMDGEIVAIEILDGQRYHAVEYGNPEFCCPHVACAVVDHARNVVRREIK